MNRLLLRRLGWVAQPVVIGLALWLMIDGPRRDVREPLVFAGPDPLTFAETKSVMDHGARWTLPEFGTPPGDPTFLPLREAHIDLVLVRIAAVFSRQPMSVVNLSWLLMLIAAGASSAWCFRRLGVSEAGAWCAGVLFALSPFALGQSTHHFGVMPYLVPFAVTAALHLAVARPLASTSGQSRTLFAGTTVLGFNMILSAVFGALFVALGAIAGYVRSRQRAPLIIGGALIAAIAMAGVVNLATAGKTRALPSVGPAVVEVYALKIRQLVTPIRDHWFSPFRKWAEADDLARFPNGTDNDRLGLIATVGFLGLLITFFVPAVGGTGESGETTRAASRLLVGGILFATLGGFSSLVNLLISPVLYDLSGMTPFLAFLALTGLAFGVDRATAGQARRWWRGAAWTCVLVLGLLDQSVAALPIRQNRLPIREEVRQLRMFVSALEGALPRGALVVQLPVRPETDTRGTLRMRRYDNFRPWLVSRNLRWSAADSYGEQAKWQTEMMSVVAEEMPARFRLEGFSAIVVDRNGFRDGGAAILDALQAGHEPASLLMQDARYVALDIRKR